MVGFQFHRINQLMETRMPTSSKPQAYLGFAFSTCSTGRSQWLVQYRHTSPRLYQRRNWNRSSSGGLTDSAADVRVSLTVRKLEVEEKRSTPTISIFVLEAS